MAVVQVDDVGVNVREKGCTFRQKGIRMGYFCTKEARDEYRAVFCRHCQHAQSCVVWTLHDVHGDEQVRKPEIGAFLGMFIPRRGLGNDPCRMFVETGETRRPSW